MVDKIIKDFLKFDPENLYEFMPVTYRIRKNPNDNIKYYLYVFKKKAEQVTLQVTKEEKNFYNQTPIIATYYFKIERVDGDYDLEVEPNKTNFINLLTAVYLKYKLLAGKE